MIGAPGPRPVPSGLGARIIGFLTVALVPLGLVAYWQTAQLESETRARSQLSVTGVTENSASLERRSILRALGAAQAIGSTGSIVAADVETCNRYLMDFRESSATYTYVGVLMQSGAVKCGSSRQSARVEDFPALLEAIKHPRPSVIRVDNPSISPEPVLVVSEPFQVNGVHQGHVAISIPVRHVRPENRPPSEFTDLITFNRMGQILTTENGYEQALRHLPIDAGLDDLSGAAEHSFLAMSADGEERIFALAPIVPDLVWALSAWPEDSSAATTLGTSGFTRSLPLVMWAASIIVAYLAVNRLVIRHIRTLRHQMRSFARDRRVPAQSASGDMALELRDMENDFLRMADSIMQDEAQLENALREKTILLKEVHHRVKNNLQLISSIMNMQIRQSANAETKVVLQRLQERIRGLATIHRNLYQTGDLGHVNAADLLGDLIGQMSIVSGKSSTPIEVTKSLEPIEVYPDQAMPISLLTAEALTNAGKYMGPDPDGVCRLHIALHHEDDQAVILEISNSTGESPIFEDATRSGLGNRLIQAFSTQLGGTLHQGAEGDRYKVTVLFHLSDFKPEVVDY
ncbi:hypothetical protein SAMN05444413_10893 [Roseivivax marinus]|uniref:sensor histidine kinase n=1 Tax=Roseivivax marinus TaxID=1379903 RepID=UPI0008B22B7E|nr:histidine kinase dimerization/phosphoacceptor domain -containing protein [Roseivivax marinus]SEL36584.1 hypothetical protein SAMN05444413_10893 [Roseivivax marinus]